ncbi:putative transcription factor C2H2 family [Helianthus debilis subsp. tardiflorus]
MSDAGERTCPLCAEEMDLTDQQLKPCKCGYDICVWCWHHIMDMSEKDNTEGRCPACRTPYNKEKIVGTASKCERLVTGMNMEKKQKSQKGKIKTAEARKELTSVRVIQRNLVYIVGLPLNLADEDLLQQKEYFGQYGKVLKVSISRTAAGEIQQFPNSTCSVYITYSKEEEAVRSIQSAHGFILEGRPLRACFGTTKYCHVWLRNTPCTNADCLYLHEYGPQEDSFTKDEIVSAYTRNKVQQITGATNDMQRRSGNFLPPPVDDYSKPISKNITNNPANTLKVSPPNSSCGRSEALPAAASWGTRASISQPIVANGASTTLPKKHCEENHNLQEKGNLGNPTSIKKTDDRTTLCKTPVTTGLSSSSTTTI